MRLITKRDSTFPRLAWLAIVDLRGDEVTAFHGPLVEAAHHFVVEGVWDDGFREGRFAESTAFFGSGLRTVPGGVVISPSRALVDRLFSCETPDGMLVANCLTLLLFATGASLEPGRSYQEETHTILKGIHAYDSRFPVQHPVLRSFTQHYYHSFRFDGNGFHRHEGPEPESFTAFEAYVQYMDDTVARILRNSTDSGRQAPLVPRFTISRGYDSPAASVLAARHVHSVAYTAVRSNSLIPGWISREAAGDDGSPIARHLGLTIRHLTATPPELDERVFHTGGSADPELIFARVADDARTEPNPVLLVTGYHGDKVWARDPGERYVTPDIRRGDVSGLALSQARLWAGFVNLALPFIGARSMPSIARISASSEMEPWSIGGEYDRPIPRRLIEEAGIPRSWFGHRKRAVLQTRALPDTHGLRPSFGRWLLQEEDLSLLRYRARVGLGHLRWAGLRAAEKAAALLGAHPREPDRWPWVPSGNPASLLHRWAVAELSGPHAPYSEEVRVEVQAHLGGDAG